tara:strand:- start:167 stop:385 length:219 start_codon:yes stop_codon:yes gene_type:complete
MYLENVIEKKILESGSDEFEYTKFDEPKDIKLDIMKHRIFAVYPCVVNSNTCKVQVHDEELNIHVWYSVKTN